MSAKAKIVYSALVCTCLLVTAVHSQEKPEGSESPFQSRSVEFQFTDQELEEMGKWKNKSLDLMLQDALMNGDRAALYMVGMSVMTGVSGLTIDVDCAYTYFLQSASFGFAPSIKQLVHENLEQGNPHLAMIYMNLLTTLGHHEYVVSYHELRSRTREVFGDGVCREIERLARSKYELIQANIRGLQEAQDKVKYCLSMLHNRTMINSQDKVIDSAYWRGFSKFKSEAVELAIRFQRVLQDDFEELKEAYYRSKENIHCAIEELKRDEDVGEVLQSSGLKDSKHAIQLSLAFTDWMKTFIARASNENLLQLAKEFLLLSHDMTEVLNAHRIFFLSPLTFIANEDNIANWKDHAAGVSLHTEKIEKLINALPRE